MGLVNLSLPKISDWKIDSNSGATITVGTPEMKVAVAASVLTVKLVNTKTNETVTLQGGGVGVSVGIGLSIPFVNGSGSLASFPSATLGNILLGVRQRDPMTAADFEGVVSIMTLGAGASGEDSEFNIIIFADGIIGMDAISTASLSLPGLGSIAGPLLSLLIQTKGISAVIGIAAATQVAGASASVVHYICKRV